MQNTLRSLGRHFVADQMRAVADGGAARTVHRRYLGPWALGLGLFVLRSGLFEVGSATRPKSTQAPPLTSRSLISSVIGLEAKPPTRRPLALFRSPN